jgi:putative GTP pyrophosphokinase
VHNAEILADYDRLSMALETTSAILAGQLRSRIKAQGIRLYALQHRVKTRASLAAKIARPDKTYGALAQVTDVIGLRVVAYFEDQLDAIATLLEQDYAVDFAHSVDKTKALESSEFGYRSIHYVCAAPVADLRFEVQLCSALQHAWAEVEHDLGYKTEADVPWRIRRRFSRLAGLLELVDEEFVAIRDAQVRYASEVSRAVEADAQAVHLDRLSVESFAHGAPVAALDAALADSSGLPLGEEVFFPDYLCRGLQHVGLRTIAEVREGLALHGDGIRGLLRHYFEFTRQAFRFDARSMDALPRGYCLLLLPHQVLLDRHPLKLQRLEALGRLYTVLDYPDDEPAARAVARRLIDSL